MNDPHIVTQLIDLQTRSAFQEDLLRELNDIVARQQMQIDTLERQLLLHRDKIAHLIDNLPDRNAAAPQDERPPHY